MERVPPLERRATFSRVVRVQAATVAIRPVNQAIRESLRNVRIIPGDECCDLLQICQSCLGIDYRAVHAAIRARTSAAE